MKIQKKVKLGRKIDF